MISDEPNNQGIRRSPEKNSPVKPEPALEQIATQLPDPEPAMLMRLTENVPQFEELKNDFGALASRKGAKLFLHARIDEQRFFQEPPSHFQAVPGTCRRAAWRRFAGCRLS